MLLLHSGMTEVAKTTTNYLSPGSICWAAFLAMGARLDYPDRGYGDAGRYHAA